MVKMRRGADAGIGIAAIALAVSLLVGMLAIRTPSQASSEIASSPAACTSGQFTNQPTESSGGTITNNCVQPAPYPCNYNIQISAGVVTAYNCVTGVADYSGTNSTSVIQSAENNLPSGATGGGVLFFGGGNFSAANGIKTITISRPGVIEGSGSRTIFETPANYNKPIFKITAITRVVFMNFRELAYSNGQGIGFLWGATGTSASSIVQQVDMVNLQTGVDISANSTQISFVQIGPQNDINGVREGVHISSSGSGESVTHIKIQGNKFSGCKVYCVNVASTGVTNAITVGPNNDYTAVLVAATCAVNFNTANGLIFQSDFDSSNTVANWICLGASSSQVVVEQNTVQPGKIQYSSITNTGSQVQNNNYYNPVNKLTNAWTGTTVGCGGTKATPGASGGTYTLTCFWQAFTCVESGVGVVTVAIKDGSGNTIASGLTCTTLPTNPWPFGYKLTITNTTDFTSFTAYGN